MTWQPRRDEPPALCSAGCIPCRTPPPPRSRPRSAGSGRDSTTLRPRSSTRRSRHGSRCSPSSSDALSRMPTVMIRHAWHLLAWDERHSTPVLAGYLRVLDPGRKFAEPSIGRVLTVPPYRGIGFGRTLMAEGLARARLVWPGWPIRIAAQQRLERFYARTGLSDSRRAVRRGRHLARRYARGSDRVGAGEPSTCAHLRYYAPHSTMPPPMKQTFLDFEQPIAELQAKIDELRFVHDDSAVDISDEIARLHEEEPAAHEGDLRQAHRVADRAGRAPSAAAVHARLHQRHVHRLPRAARRPHATRTTPRSSAASRASTASRAW